MTLYQLDDFSLIYGSFLEIHPYTFPQLYAHLIYGKIPIL